MARCKRVQVPGGIGEKLKVQIFARGFTVRQAARELETPEQSLYDTFVGTQNLARNTAAKLTRLGIDGRALYLEQASNQLRHLENLEKRHQAKEAQKRQIEERLAAE